MNFLGSFLSAIKPRNDDDTVDRLNYYYTCVIILVLSITISAKQYVGQPIQCWVPAQFTGAWEQYAENYCFVQNTYWLPLYDPIPQMHMDRDNRQIGYYQWVPFILAMEAVFFYLPCIFWRQMNWQSGIDILSIIKMAGNTDNIQGEARKKAVTTITRHIEDSIELQRDFSDRDRSILQSIVLHCGKAKGTYVTMLYIFTKLLYIVNVVIQFFVMNEFLGHRFHMWGIQILYDISKGSEWEDTGKFPRVTLCDFEVRVLGNLHRYTIQCVLMINMFNEKIFLFLWWWFVLVFCATAVNTFYWIGTTWSHRKRLGFVERYLRVANRLDERDRFLLNQFADDGLRPDGVLVMRMLASHAGDLIATDIINELWQSFRKAAMEKVPELCDHRDSYAPNPKETLLLANSDGRGGFVETLNYEPPNHKYPVRRDSTGGNGGASPPYSAGSGGGGGDREQLISRRPSQPVDV